MTMPTLATLGRFSYPPSAPEFLQKYRRCGVWRGPGCAWSTMLCVWFNLLGLLWWMKRSPEYRSTWPLDRFELPHWPQVRSLLKLGVPIGVTYFTETSAFSLIALVVTQLGNAQVAAHQIALSFSSL